MDWAYTQADVARRIARQAQQWAELQLGSPLRAAYLSGLISTYGLKQAWTPLEEVPDADDGSFGILNDVV